MDKWVVKDPVLSGNTRALEIPQSYLRIAPGYKNVVDCDGIETQEAFELSGECLEIISDGDGCTPGTACLILKFRQICLCFPAVYAYGITRERKHECNYVRCVPVPSMMWG